jgi:hypothetical protein
MLVRKGMPSPARTTELQVPQIGQNGNCNTLQHGVLSPHCDTKATVFKKNNGQRCRTKVQTHRYNPETKSTKTSFTPYVQNLPLQIAHIFNLQIWEQIAVDILTTTLLHKDVSVDVSKI